MKVHFLNVGHGDCTVIEHDSNRISVIDLNNGTEIDKTTLSEISESYPAVNMKRAIAEVMGLSVYSIVREAGYDIELTNPVEFLLSEYPGKSIFRYIQTHPHLDHMRGLAALAEEGIAVTNFWDTEHDFTPDLKNDEDRVAWNEYCRMRKEGTDPKVLRLYRGAAGTFWNEDPKDVTGGDGIEILYPTASGNAEASNADCPNNLSYVLRLQSNGLVIILGGDAEEKVWEELVELEGNDLKCNVLKASHHGRDSGYLQAAVEIMSPEYTIVSVGQKPDTDASNKYRKYSGNVWSTRWKGNITVDTSSRGMSAQYDR